MFEFQTLLALVSLKPPAQEDVIRSAVFCNFTFYRFYVIDLLTDKTTSGPVECYKVIKSVNVRVLNLNLCEIK